MLAVDTSWQAAEAWQQTHGGFGFAEEYGVVFVQSVDDGACAWPTDQETAK